MKSQRYLTMLLMGALLVCDFGAAVAQEAPQPRVRREAQVKDRVIYAPAPGPDGQMPFHFETIVSGPGEPFGFSFVSAEMNFEGKLVKGAPYSAEAITETVQTLSDGNRLTRKSTATVHRDSEGRTRRDQTLGAIGPWATAEEPTRAVFINDPVSGTHYILDPEHRTARKSQFFFRTAAGKSGTAFEFHIAPPPEPGAPPSPPGGPSQGALKRVQPDYPPIAKAAGAQGTVAVEIVINETGEVISAKAVEGHPLLHQASVEAARQWQFKPTEIDGKPAKVTGRVTFNFVLPEKEREQDPPLRVRAPMRAPAPPHIDALPAAQSQAVKETLGKQSIEGVEAEGTRTTLTIPAGAIGNERPINIVSERWYSPELQLVLMSKHSDPRFGETTYRLTNINRSEPARTLFEVPGDYTLKYRNEEERAPSGFRMRRRSNEQ
ncbi:MAG: energy transducer TonB [Pyrinomonadaceae bacterium]|nr:energy transducer TonB [Pyrinomonadaceae bacterium]